MQEPDLKASLKEAIALVEQARRLQLQINEIACKIGDLGGAKVYNVDGVIVSLEQVSGARRWRLSVLNVINV